jgi:DNA-binding transcriptional LysR family regulator
MELRDLGYFVACVEEGNVTRAARRCHVAQPTVSHALARLEESVGERLLERLPRAGVKPTPAGLLLVARARASLRSIEAFGSDLSALRGLQRGLVQIASIQSLNVTLLAPVLADFSQRYPGVDLSVHTYPAAAVAQAMIEHRADLGIVAGVPMLPSPELLVEVLYREAFVVIVRRGDPLAQRRPLPVRALADRPLALVPADSHTGRVIYAACAEAGFAPRVKVTLDSGEALREAVRAGIGITILPERYLPPHDTGLVSVPLRSPRPSREVLLLRPRTTTASAAVEAFVELLRSVRVSRRAP